jgi:hypothetical protein
MIEEGQVWHAKPYMVNGKKYVGPKARVDRVRLLDMADGTQEWSIFYSSIGPGTCKGDGGACRLDTFEGMYYRKDEQLRLGA